MNRGYYSQLMVQVNTSFVDTHVDGDTLPLIMRRVHPTLGHVADAWFTDGQDAYQVRLYAPREPWVDGVIREVSGVFWAASRLDRRGRKLVKEKK
jgi:hypothetical protein